LYPWLWRGVAAASVATTLAEKRPYIHPLFVVARALLYLGVWIAVAEWFRRARTRGYGEQRSAATARLSAVGIILIGVTFAFASFDWLMTLEPNASLAVYAPYYFAGASVGALALLAVIAGVAMRATDHTVVSRDVLDAVGKLLLSFVLLWTYLAYVQYLIIWIGDLPTEIGWVAARTRNGWQSIALVLIIGNCILPTLALLLPVARRNAIPMIVIGAVLLTMHFLDVFWLVTPARFPRAAVPGWIELAALVAIIGLALSGAMWRGVARASPSAAPEKVSL
jgi:hypothetical protein